MALGYISVDDPSYYECRVPFDIFFILLSFVFCSSLLAFLPIFISFGLQLPGGESIVLVAISTSYCANSPPRGDYVWEDKRHLTAYARNLFSYTYRVVFHTQLAEVLDFALFSPPTLFVSRYNTPKPHFCRPRVFLLQVLMFPRLGHQETKPFGSTWPGVKDSTAIRATLGLDKNAVELRYSGASSGVIYDWVAPDPAGSTPQHHHGPNMEKLGDEGRHH